MPLYFFDMHDGDHYTRDDTGTELPDLEAARKEAIGVLPDIARNVLPNGNRRDMIVDVRDRIGRYVFTATLSLVARELQNDVSPLHLRPV